MCTCSKIRGVSRPHTQIPVTYCIQVNINIFLQSGVFLLNINNPKSQGGSKTHLEDRMEVLFLSLCKSRIILIGNKWLRQVVPIVSLGIIYLSIYLSQSVSINPICFYLSTYLSDLVSINLFLILSISPWSSYIYLSFYLSITLCSHLSVYLSLYLSKYIYLSIYPGVMVVITGYGHGDTSSIPGQD